MKGLSTEDEFLKWNYECNWQKNTIIKPEGLCMKRGGKMSKFEKKGNKRNLTKIQLYPYLFCKENAKKINIQRNKIN